MKARTLFVFLCVGILSFLMVIRPSSPLHTATTNRAVSDRAVSTHLDTAHHALPHPTFHIAPSPTIPADTAPTPSTVPTEPVPTIPAAPSPSAPTLGTLLSQQPAYVQQEFACIRHAESDTTPTVWNRTGSTSDGLYQFTVSTWQANGGGQFAPYAADATVAEQNDVAVWTYEHDGWSPWTGDPCVG